MTLLGGLLVLASPTAVAAAAPGQAGPSRKEIVMLLGLAVAACVIAFFLYRLLYTMLLHWDWPIDFAVGIAITAFLLAILAIGLFVYQRLWPQAWAHLAWWVLGATLLCLILVGLFGHARQPGEEA